MKRMLTSGRKSEPLPLEDRRLWSNPVTRQQRGRPGQRGRRLFFQPLVSAHRSGPESKRQICFYRAESLGPWMTDRRLPKHLFLNMQLDVAT